MKEINSEIFLSLLAGFSVTFVIVAMTELCLETSKPGQQENVMK
jgi:hypothetical protein